MTLPAANRLTDGSPPEVDAAELRQVMRQHAAGVAVITTYWHEPVGFSATSLNSVTLDPPTVSFAVAADSASGRAWASTDRGVVHLLRADQAGVAAVFGRPGPEKFTGAVKWRWGPHGHPLLEDVLAWMVVRPRTRLTVGSHRLLICAVEQTSVTPGLGPLVHHAGGFHALPA